MVGFALHLFELRQQSYAITLGQEHICVCTISTLHTTSDLGLMMFCVDDFLSFADMALGQASVLPGLGGPGPVEVIFSSGWLSHSKTENGLRSGMVSREKWL